MGYLLISHLKYMLKHMDPFAKWLNQKPELKEIELA